MSVITPVKTIQSVLLALQTVATAAAAAGKVASSALDVSTKIAGTFVIRIGRTAVTAFTASTSVDCFIQGSYVASGDEAWFDLMSMGTGALAACNTNAVHATGGAVGVGDSSNIVLTASSSVDYSLNKDLIYFKNGTVANGEFHKCRFASTGSTSLYIAEDLVRSQSGGNIYNGNTEFVVTIDLQSILRTRVLIINNSGLSVDILAYMLTQDNMTSV